MNINQAKRIYILGTSGSGKSYLAGILSKKLSIPRYDLDNILYHVKYTKKRKVENRIKMLKPLAKKKKWILEGVYGSWIEDALKKADIVIVLDIPLRILAWRILSRYFKRIGKEKESLKDAIDLIRYASKYKKGDHSSGYKSHMNLIKKYQLKKIIIKNKKELNNLLNKIK